MGAVYPCQTKHVTEENPDSGSDFLSEENLTVCETVSLYTPRNPEATVL